MKIGFFGTPDIAAFCISQLQKELDIAFAVTGADKPAGRNRKMQCCPVKETIMKSGVPVFHPDRLTDPDFIEKLKAVAADLFIVVAYGRIIPVDVYTMPRLGTINLHPSLLPRYRGAAPIQWALINGETETGITVQMINERLDAGDILLQQSIPVTPEMTAGDLYEIVLPLGADMLIRAVKLLEEGKAQPLRQNESEASYCGKIDKELPRIRWEKSAVEIHNLVRGLNPRPGAWTGFRSMTIKIWKTRPFREASLSPTPGEIVVIGKKRCIVGTGDGMLEILSIQPERKRIMDGVSFINGYRLEESEMFTPE